MLFLWIFGDNVEDGLGHVRYAVFYLARGVAATRRRSSSTPHSTLPIDRRLGRDRGRARRLPRPLPAGARRHPRLPRLLRPGRSRSRRSSILALWFSHELLSGARLARRSLGGAQAASPSSPTSAASSPGRSSAPPPRRRPAGAARRRLRMSEPRGGRWVRRPPRRRFGPARLAALALLLLALDALWLEPRVLVVGRSASLEVAAPPLRVALLSDLHIAAETGQLRRLLAQVAAAYPDVVLVAGDWVRDDPDEAVFARHAAAAASFAGAAGGWRRSTRSRGTASTRGSSSPRSSAGGSAGCRTAG